MKPRKVFVTLELETDVPLLHIRSGLWWENAIRDAGRFRGYTLKTVVLEAQANVAKPQGKKAKAKKQ
jgi:N-glycosylase/DNA lyase